MAIMQALRGSTKVLRYSRPLQAISPAFKRTISTSDKKKDSHVAHPEPIGDVKKFENWNVPENWVSYGFDFKDEGHDKLYWFIIKHAIVFSLLWSGFVNYYAPNQFADLDWIKREAYLELERRRNAGLPLVDPNYADPDEFHNHTDEELGPNFEVII